MNIILVIVILLLNRTNNLQDSFNNRKSLLGTIFIINNGAETLALPEEYKLFRNPSLNRDISKVGKMQQKYLALYMTEHYSFFFESLNPDNIQIYTNQKLKCIRSAIIFLTTTFFDFSFYFEESTKSALAESYKDQEKILSELKELKINYEHRKINNYYKSCKYSLIRQNLTPLDKNSQTLLLLSKNEYIDLVIESNFCIQTTMDIYDMIILNRTFSDIPLNSQTELMV